MVSIYDCCFCGGTCSTCGKNEENYGQFMISLESRLGWLYCKCKQCNDALLEARDYHVKTVANLVTLLGSDLVIRRSSGVMEHGWIITGPGRRVGDDYIIPVGHRKYDLTRDCMLSGLLECQRIINWCDTGLLSVAIPELINIIKYYV